jgi:hypothetical protein
MPKAARKKLSPGTTFFHGRSNFNTVETAVLVLLLGVVGVVSYRRFTGVRATAYATTVESGLRMLSLAEEGFFGDHDHYSADLDSLSLSATAGVSIRLLEASATGWSAQGAHAKAHRVCALFSGAAAAVAPAIKAGVVACK